jgi:hypothetical protein
MAALEDSEYSQRFLHRMRRALKASPQVEERESILWLPLPTSLQLLRRQSLPRPE